MLLRTIKLSRFIVMILIMVLFTLILPSASAQEDNVCRDAGAPVLTYGDVLTGTIDPTLPFSLFCFDAERGTNVTITIQPQSPNLLTGFIVGTPFINSDGSFEDPLLLEETASTAGTPYQGTVTITSDGTYLILVQSIQDSIGTFNIAIELSGGNVLGSSNPEPTNADTTSTDGDGITNIIFGETDLCTTAFTSPLVYGDTASGSTNDVEPIFYCIEANEADIITLDFTIEAIPMGFFIVDPLYDGTQNAPVYAQGLAQVEGETVNTEFLVPRTGRYVLVVIAAIPETGNYTVTLNGVAGNVYTCENDPINTLVNKQWGIQDENGTAIIEINIACSERLSIATFGGAIIAPFSVSQEDEFFFIYQNRLYVTTSLSDEEWVIEREDGQSFTLRPLTDETTCSDEQLSALIAGSWLWELDATQSIFFDFTCNGIVLIDDQQSEAFAADYSFADGIITILLGDQPLVFENVTVADDAMNVLFNGIDFAMRNALYVAPSTEE
ncbi:MAG: hypothetical protein WBC91_11490 [Phototrophicaceae bacterium]